MITFPAEQTEENMSADDLPFYQKSSQPSTTFCCDRCSIAFITIGAGKYPLRCYPLVQIHHSHHSVVHQYLPSISIEHRSLQVVALPVEEGLCCGLTSLVQHNILLSADRKIEEVSAMAPSLGDVIHRARRARKLTLRQLAEQVTKDDGTPVSPQYLNDIELHHRVPTPHVLRELARVLTLDYDTLLASAGAADVVVQEYLKAYPQHAEGIIKLFRVAQQSGFQDWHDLRQRIEHRHKGAR
jgi:transcriptional regulator with XRE-family HTH domain